MAKERFAGVTPACADLLRKARRQLEIVNAARRRCNEIVSSKAAYRSPRVDGMPRGKNKPCGLDGSTEQAERLLSILRREEKRLSAYRCKVQKMIEAYPEGLYEFCKYYYLDGLSVLEASALMGKSERTGWNYKRSIEQARMNRELTESEI